MGKGVETMEYLNSTFGMVDENDVTAATVRVLTCWIEPNSTPSMASLQYQYDTMMLANNEVIAAGGTGVPDATMRSYFLSCLRGPQWLPIRQMVRTQEHATFAALFNAFMTLLRDDQHLANIQRGGASPF